MDDDMNSVSHAIKQTNESYTSDLGLYSALEFFTPEIHGEDIEELKRLQEIKRTK